jgi:hypothetical protein
MVVSIRFAANPMAIARRGHPHSATGGRPASAQLADAQFLRGWLAAQDGDFDAGIDGMSNSVRQRFGGAAFGRRPTPI